MSDTDTVRLTRAKNRAITKRSGYVDRIRSIHALAQKSLHEPAVAPQLLVLVEELDEIWTAFVAENDVVLDCLIDLNLMAEYSNNLEVELRELIAFSKATANSHRDDASDHLSLSRHSGSLALFPRDTVGVIHHVQQHDQVTEGSQAASAMNPSGSINGEINSGYNAQINSVLPTLVGAVDGARLPKIPLPWFNGDIYNWTFFRDRFSAMVDQRPNLSNVDKLYYLLGCLKGEALEAVRGIPTSGDNYNLAWSTLQTLYDRPRLVATSLVERLIKVPISSHEALPDLMKFVSLFDENVTVLKSMAIPDLGDFILFTLASRCLPASCRAQFEERVVDTFPTVSELVSFIKKRVAVLQLLQGPAAPKAALHSSSKTKSLSKFHNLNDMHSNKGGKPQHSAFLTTEDQRTSTVCKCCQGAHALGSCNRFKSWSLENRVKWTRENHVCFRCLRSGHWAPKCRSKSSCAKCSRNHHILLHPDDKIPKTQGENTATVERENNPSTSSLMSHNNSFSVLLGTALVHVPDVDGSMHTVRALIDSASQICAMTTACSKRLGLRVKKWTAPVSGLAGASVNNVQGLVNCSIQPRFASAPLLPVTAWVFPSITSDVPRSPIPTTIVHKYSNLALADPNFDSPAQIDLLLGADIFALILDGKRVTVDASCPVAFGSVFGWVIIGSVPTSTQFPPQSCPISLTTSLETMMERFWHVEEPVAAPTEFTTEGQCEVIYQNESYRNSSGRFVVPLPFRDEYIDEKFTGSREVALRRFKNLERKLHSQPRLLEMYSNFMNEYERLGHMSVATQPGLYYIPHHPVFKSSSPDSNIRVVFDASAVSSSGKSLNQCLHPGPKLQLDIIDILLRFRVHRYVLTTDICKMYRQILVDERYLKYQHIFWRSSLFDELKEFRLNTVTYGVNSAPFLALRVLKDVAEKECDNFPLVKEALSKQTYVDDICVGTDSEHELLSLQRDLIITMGRAGFELKKWSSNCAAVMSSVSVSDRAVDVVNFEDCDKSVTKVLGLQWDAKDDVFTFNVQILPHTTTKRSVLSVIARIFDPLGFLAPVIFYAKHVMQQVWKTQLSWDDPLPGPLAGFWSDFIEELPLLSNVRVPRFLGTAQNCEVQLCGFCDASERGYSAVVYLRLVKPNNSSQVTLLGSKTKMSPMKGSTIPRLELCGAVLLAKWMSRIQNVFESKLNLTKVCAWTDSQIVLSWLVNPHTSFKVFVSNRIHLIQTLIPDCQWSHVSSEDNPADCASRGMRARDLTDHRLYWEGPPWLSESIESTSFATSPIPVEQLPEYRLPRLDALVVQEESPWYARFSSYNRLVRTTAWMQRFIHRARRHQEISNSAFLSRVELDYALYTIVRLEQRLSFHRLHHELIKQIPVSSRDIARLRPFIDDKGLICVGGRLRHSNLSEAQKFPLLLAKSSHLSTLIVRYWHKMTCHSGPNVLCVVIGRQFWILSLRMLIRTVISKCTRCVRVSAVNPQPIMADLPRVRVSESRPFSRVGVDFAGPLVMKENRLRKARQYKVYVAVFVCFVVKAIHVEIVSDLSTQAFLAALDRFVARRGLPTDIYSDCGTNFVGAARQFRILFNDSHNQDQIVSSIHSQWHFNPPSAPHFGGLWEAAVKSTKRLLRRVMGEHAYTLEELSTLLCRVESILNSRPLTPMSNDPSDLQCLTPGHFLIGQPLLAVPEASIACAPATSLVCRWKLLHQCLQTFWKRWHSEYLQTLQQRSRWIADQPQIKINDMVIIKDSNTPPLLWRIGRVIEVMPGKDSVVRVVRVRTIYGEVIRPVVKLVLLPSN